MVRSFLQTVGVEVKGMHQAAYLLALFALGSQLLALVRDRLLAAAFGAGHTLDVYYAAFRLPDFLFATVASLLSLYDPERLRAPRRRASAGRIGRAGLVVVTCCAPAAAAARGR